MEEKVSFWEVVFTIWSFPGNNYLIKVSNWSLRIKRENCSSENSRARSMVSFWYFYCLMWPCFTRCSNYLLWTGKLLLGSYKHYWTWDHIYHVVFQCEQNLLTNSMWTYTIATLRVDQWKILAKDFTSDINSGYKVRLTFKMTCCTFVQTLLAGRVIRFSTKLTKLF